MRAFLTFIFCVTTTLLSAQDSLATKELQEVVVTATRSERTLAELPVPLTVISKQQISKIGSLRLSDVLTEQTGLTIISDHGTGIQVQGFSPEYTLILVDGEPLIGRVAGTLELSRVAVGNIKQIEIVKGPSSSLYGTEALAGVINIITENPGSKKAALTSRYGTNNTFDVGASADYKHNKFGLTFFANRYSTNGYDLTADAGSTISPFNNYTVQSKVSYAISPDTKLSVSGRYFAESQNGVTTTTETGELLHVNSATTDWNINPVVSHNFSDKLKGSIRFYGSGYGNTTDYLYQSSGGYYDSSFFEQRFYRPELQVEYFINSKNILTAGAGRIWETVEATRYSGKMQYETNYAYFQYEWQATNKLNLIAGGRYDHNLAYAAQFSPKIAVQYTVTDWLKARASYGVGFRAPDFRQLYLNFTNSTVGYSVFGSQEIAAGVQRFTESGEIQTVLVDPSTFGEIQSESSQAYNAGFTLTPFKKATLNVGFFRNDIKDLIDTKAVALKTNGSFIYSYLNLDRVFTQGLEADASYTIIKNLSASVGYQYLVAKDKGKIEELKKGEVYKKDPETNITTRVKPEEYGGLLNRSRHMLNAKVFYENPATGWGANVRAIYRGRYGYADLNNSTILDDDSEYISGYVTCNVAISKEFKDVLRLQAGCDNLLNYTNPTLIASLPGRLLWVSAGATLQYKK